MRKSIKTAVKSLLLSAGVLRLRQMLLPRSVAILYYHSVSTDRASQSNAISSGITIQSDRFDEQMRILRKEYNPITMDELLDWIRFERNDTKIGNLVKKGGGGVFAA
jgi:hypothetical protein